MDNTCIYTDETLGYKNSYRINVTIWGDKANCNEFHNDIRQMVQRDSLQLGKDFKGFHAKNLNGKNWNVLSIFYEFIIKKLKEYNLNNKLNIHLTIESREKYNSNTGYLKNHLRKLLNDPNENRIKAVFSSLKAEDYPALYQRVDKLMVYWRYKDKYGKEGALFEYYPDSSGKVLEYKNKSFEVQGNLPIIAGIEFYRIIALLANSFAKVFQETGWLKDVNQKMVKFEPLNDEESYILQACDIFSNFFYHNLLYSVGVKEANSELKSELFAKYFPVLNLNESLLTSFEIDSDNIVCKNPKMYGNLYITQQETK